MKYLWKHKQRLCMVLADIVLTVAAYLLANLFRFEWDIPANYIRLIKVVLPLLVLVRVGTFLGFGLYRGVWAYATISDLIAIVKAVTAGSVGFTVVLAFLGMPGHSRAILIMDWLIVIMLVGGMRLSIRLCNRLLQPRRSRTRPALIIGAGDAGEMLIREIERSPDLDHRVIGFVDDDPEKQGRLIHGIEVVGSIDQFPMLCRKLRIQEVLIAIPSAGQEQKRRILERCRTCDGWRACRTVFRTVPALSDLLQGKARIGQLQEVCPEDLLGRDAVRLDLERLRQELYGKRILVTGAAGSIGSELCRQLAAFEPEVLILFDRAESSLYFVHLEIKDRYPHLKIVPIIGDILNQSRIEEVIHAYAPNVLYHTAAYKHVPLMEEHPLEAVQNNVFGTETVVLAARKMGVKKVVLISTDKAVRPVGIMGMTKRVAERVLLSLDGSQTTGVTIRFGNVLGSDGSVLPLFQWQIARGRAVTVTGPEASRYFMLLSEAAQLVLQAGVMGQGGEIFYLDMGEPMRILDLAHNVIRLSGLEPGREVPIEMIQLRPGERLREELVAEREHLLQTAHEKIFVVQKDKFDEVRFHQDLESLRGLVLARDRDRTIERLKAMAASY